MEEETGNHIKPIISDFLYRSLVAVAETVFIVNLFPPNLNPDSARYMLSALVQSEAAIFAIVVTLSLVAVQLAAASYSPRLIGLFQKTRYFWFFVILYIIAIVLYSPTFL